MIHYYLAGLATFPVLVGLIMLCAWLFDKNHGSWCGGPCGRRFGRVGRNFKATTEIRAAVHHVRYYRGRGRWACNSPAGATDYEVDRWAE